MTLLNKPVLRKSVTEKPVLRATTTTIVEKPVLRARPLVRGPRPGGTPKPKLTKEALRRKAEDENAYWEEFERTYWGWEDDREEEVLRRKAEAEVAGYSLIGKPGYTVRDRDRGEAYIPPLA